MGEPENDRNRSPTQSPLATLKGPDRPRLSSMSSSLTVAERLKLRLLAEGLVISPPAMSFLLESNENRQLTPADFASTSGVILRLDDDVWVNAPIPQYNANFVRAPAFTLDRSEDGLVVYGDSLESAAKFWLSPAFHGMRDVTGRLFNYYAFTHGDRVRLSPLQGCAMRCHFCNVPYEDRYATKPVDDMVEAVRRALSDQIQPAQHILISGGTPIPRDIPYLQEVYERILSEFPGVDVDIMMVPAEGLLDVEKLRTLGLHELSINIELYNEQQARTIMRQKYRQGLDHYLDFIESATAILGPGRVRSMLMVGLESIESTLAGVKAILERGGIPVLSPFRPDPATPLRDLPPPSARDLEEVYLRATDIASDAHAYLGPTCLPCTHNTLTLSGSHPDGLSYRHRIPKMV
jgi:hypothetical protein